MRSNPTIGQLVSFMCHAGEDDQSITVDARVREVHDDGTLDLEVLVSDVVTINKRRIPYGAGVGCWTEKPVELVDAEEVPQ